jgi:RNA polymerase sigma factor (sigma-70 family)
LAKGKGKNTLHEEKVIPVIVQQEEALIQQHRRLLLSVVNRFKWAVHKGETAYEDLVSEATIGMIKAIRGYNPAQGAQFTTFAVAYMQGEIRNYLSRRVPIIKIHRPTYELAGHILRRELTDESPFEISQALNCSPQAAHGALKYIRESKVSSVEKPIDENGNTIMDCLGRNDDVSELDVAEFMNSLNPRFRQVVELRLAGKSQSDIGERFGISQTQVCRILSDIGAKLQAFWGFQIAR